MGDCMEDFSAFLVIAFPRPWPLSLRTVLGEFRQEGRLIYLVGYPDGHLEIAVGSQMLGITVRRHFQRLEIGGSPGDKAILSVVCADDQIDARINGQPLKMLSESGGTTLVVDAQQRVTPTYSIDDPSARRVCEEWIQSRQSRFASRKEKTKLNTRPKSLDEQLEELAQAADALVDLAEQARSGKKHMFPPLAAQLRSLIHWPNDGPNWNPLLYRLANRRSLPLPVFGFPDDLDRPLVINEAAYHAENLSPSITRRAPAEVVMDLQQYMQSTVQTERRLDGPSSLTVDEAVGATGNSLGAAHYDEIIRLDVDLLRMQVALNASLLHRVIVGVAETVAVLGRYVVHESARGSG
jgi:hypothetical protein